MCSLIELQKPVRPATGGVLCGGSLFLEVYMAKPFLSYEDQLNKLANEKALTIPDREYAMTMLQRIGYFSLIGGYKAPFKNPTNNLYYRHVKFEDIVALYAFDEDLRELFFKYILQVERHIRSLLAYSFTEKHGELQTEYLDPGNYDSDPAVQDDVNRLINTLDKLANRTSDYPYINHQRNTYGNVPLWVLMNGITFGTLSKFYLLSTQDVKTKVAKNFYKVNEKQLTQYLTVMTKFRNVCAHNERLYSYKTKDNIPNTTLHTKLSIPQKGAQFVSGKRDLFAMVIAFRYLLPNEEFLAFKKNLNVILKNYYKRSSALPPNILLKHMGFPKNWNNITRYKK